MTRKDFISLAQTTARILNSITQQEKNLRIEPTNAENLKNVVLNQIIGFCNSQNSLFDEKRFESKIKEFVI